MDRSMEILEPRRRVVVEEQEQDMVEVEGQASALPSRSLRRACHTRLIPTKPGQQLLLLRPLLLLLPPPLPLPQPLLPQLEGIPLSPLDLVPSPRCSSHTSSRM